MRMSLRIAFAVLPLALVPPPQLSAQEAPADEPMAAIAAALTRIAEVMELQLESGRLDLLMRRQDLSQRRLDRVEGQLRSAQRELDGLRQNAARADMEIARLADPEVAESMGWDAASLAGHLESMEFELAEGRRKIAELESWIGQLEQERARRQRELEDWQAFMDREITGLQ